MVEFLIAKRQIERAKKHFETDVMNGSFTRGAGNVHGALGEIMVSDYFTGSVITHDPDFDILLESGLRVDVKTKLTRVKPTLEWNGIINNWNTTQNCDLYVFCAVLDNLRRGYMCGWIEPETFYNRAKWIEAGDFIPKSNHKMLSSGYCLEFRHMKRHNAFVDFRRKYLSLSKQKTR